MERRYLTVPGAAAKYGPKPPAWRKWIRSKQLGSGVVRFGKLVFLDSVVLDERIARTGRLLVDEPEPDKIRNLLAAKRGD